MRTPGARLRDKAAAVVAINNVGKQSYAWDKEPDIHQRGPKNLRVHWHRDD